jgi:hypothetical protein
MTDDCPDACHRLRRPIFIGVILAAFNTAQADDECQLNVSESRLDFGLMNRAAQRDSAASVCSASACA